jgi:nitrite reductase/ring-hydroxylating ferredoxin subunit
MKKEDVEKAKTIISNLHKAKFDVTGVEMIKLVRSFEWLADEMTKATKFEVVPEKEEAIKVEDAPHEAEPTVTNTEVIT